MTRSVIKYSGFLLLQLAAGLVDMAIGGDQGGSIRNPASRCGIVGLKPTHGLVPYTGALPLESSLDHLGPMARTVYDVALVLEVCYASQSFWKPHLGRIFEAHH